MSRDQTEVGCEPLETAMDLERAGIVKRACAYKLAKGGVLPCYLVGPKQTGVRFRRSEVLAALRRPTAEKSPQPAVKP
jgi:hypothetical protein